MGTVLVTGGTGFIGKYVAHSLAEAGQDVLVTYRRYFRRPAILSDEIGSRVKTVRCDVMDLPGLCKTVRDNGVDSVVHLANMSNYEGTIYQTMQTNIQGTINVLEAASFGPVKKVTYASSVSIATSHVGNEPAIGVEDESVPIASGSTNVISPSKKVGEILTMFYGATFGVSTAIVRPGLIYGPYNESEIGSPGVLRFILEAVFDGRPADLSEVGRNDVVRMTYVRDVADAVRLVHLAPNNQHKVYCLDRATPITWGQVEGILGEFVPGCSLKFGRSEAAPGAARPQAGLNIVAEFDFQPKYGIREGLRETVEWFRNGRP